MLDEIELEFTLRPDGDDALGRYVLAFDGTASVWDDAQGLDLRVGTIRGHRIDLVSALQDGIAQQELLESLTPEITGIRAVRTRRHPVPAAAVGRRIPGAGGL